MLRHVVVCVWRRIILRLWSIGPLLWRVRRGGWWWLSVSHRRVRRFARRFARGFARWFATMAVGGTRSRTVRAVA